MSNQSIQSKGGEARAKALTQEQRSEIARNAGLARGKLPKATHEGSIDLAKSSISCAVLSDGTRLLTQQGFLVALGRAAKAKGGQGSTIEDMVPFLAAKNLQPYIPTDLFEAARPIKFRTPSGATAFGYDAMILPKVCEVYLDARAQSALHPSQDKIADTADTIIRGLARVGIVALIDEATGYQDVRDRVALAKILEKYLMNEGYRRWEKTFPLDYYREIFRLFQWTFDPESTARPGYIGKLTNNIVYSRLKPGIMEKLRELNPSENGRRKNKHHQYFTGDIGVPELREHISNATVLMKVSKSWPDFMDKLDKVAPRVGDTLPLGLDFEG